jgi:hypothetical protein
MATHEPGGPSQPGSRNKAPGGARPRELTIACQRAGVPRRSSTAGRVAVGSVRQCPGNQVLTGLYPVFARAQNEQVRVVATRIEWDGTMQRRMVDTAYRSGEPQWENLAARALAAPPPYRPVPGTPIYHVSLDDGTVVLVAEHDLCGPLLDLVTAVLAMGEAVLARSPGVADR